MIGPLLERLDEVIASDTLRANLLPRAPHVVPQLMKTLRDESYSSVDVASRISRDVVLSAEVIRSATSTYRAKDDDEGEIDLARAVAMIGTAGLRRAIASVVLRPIFDAGGDTLSAKAAVKIWRDADRKARLSAALAGQQSLDPFDGYLAGLLHNSGWTAALRALDGFDDLLFSSVDLAHPAVVPQLLRRRDALFGAIVGPWNLSPAIDSLAAGGRPARPRRGALAARRRPARSQPARRAVRAGPDRAPAGERPCPAGRRSPSRSRIAISASAGRPDGRDADLSSRLAAGRRSLPRAHSRGSSAHDTPHHPARCRARLRRRRRHGRQPGVRRQDARLLLRRKPRGLQSAVLHHRHHRRRVVGADLQPPGRVRDRHDQHRARPGRELDRHARRPEPTPSA